MACDPSPLPAPSRRPFRPARPLRWLAPITLVLILLVPPNGAPSDAARGAQSPPRAAGSPGALVSGLAASAAPAEPASGAIVRAAAKPFPSEPGWRSVPVSVHPAARWGAAAAYDPEIGAVVMFGGAGAGGYLNDTWECIASPGTADWTVVSTSSAPSPRAEASLAYDPALGELVLFGGLGRSGPSGETWVFRGGTWTDLTNTGPSPRYGAAMAYDPSTGRLVLFGGENASAFLNDTWQLNSHGVWSEVYPASAPSPRSNAGFDFDPGLGVAVLTGGFGPSGADAKSFDWNGTDWSIDTAASDASGAGGAAMAYSDSEGALVLVGGNVSGGFANSTLELASSGLWSPPHLESTLPPRTDAAIAYSPAAGVILLFGGWNGTALSDTWAFSTGTPALSWREENGTASPSPRTDAATVYDPADGYLLLFGGESRPSSAARLGPSASGGSEVLNDTWTWSDGTWTELSTPVAPSPRFGAMIAYDPVDGYVVLFGGATLGAGNKTVYLNDTWSFRGGVWTELSPSHAPSARRGAGFVFDSSDGYLLLYGGHNATASGVTTYLGDTWSFVGGEWTRRSPTGAPPAVSQPQMAFDPTSGYVVLNGGYASTGAGGASLPVRYTWEYLTNRWTNLSAALASNAPSARAAGAFVFDPSAGALLLIGGNNATSTLSDVWSFRAGGFTEECSACALRLKDPGQVAYDDGDGALLAFGAPVSGTTPAETWLNVSLLTAEPSVAPPSADLGTASHFSVLVGGGVAPLTARWTFDGGNATSAWSVTHTFPTVGPHNASFTLTDGAGATLVRNLTIDVHALPSASLIASPWGPGLLGARLNVSVLGGSGPFVYNYSFGDGASESSDSPVAYHTYASAGSYNASVEVTDALGAQSSAVAGTLRLPAVVPTVSISASALARAPPAAFQLSAIGVDPHGGVAYTWSATTTPGPNTTHFTFRASGASATLNLPKPLAAAASAQVSVLLADSDNFTASATLNLTLLPSMAGGLSDTVLSFHGCPAAVATTEFALSQNVSGGQGPYTFNWTVGSSTLTGAAVDANLTPGTSVPVTLVAVDSVGDNYTVARTLLVPAATCPPSSRLPGPIELAAIGAAVLLVGLIALEVVLLRRRRRAPGPLQPAASPQDPGSGPGSGTSGPPPS